MKPSLFSRAIDRCLHAIGYEIRRMKGRPSFAREAITPEDIAIIENVRPYTMASWERIYAVIQAVHYIEANSIAGDIVECGVWRGGSTMAAAETLMRHASTMRHLYLYDTFEGMSAPTEHDRSIGDADAGERFAQTQTGDDRSNWCYASLEDVEQNIQITRYPTQRIHYVEGKVEDMIPSTMPETIALLRLDTDWYESTRHELIHLYPRLVRGGVLIIDDYGHWQGARKAVDEYFAQHGIQLLLQRTDYTGRMAIKC